MEMRAHVIEVIFDGGWKIAFEGHQFGPYCPRIESGSPVPAVVFPNGHVLERLIIDVQLVPSGALHVELSCLPLGKAGVDVSVIGW